MQVNIHASYGICIYNVYLYKMFHAFFGWNASKNDNITPPKTNMSPKKGLFQ